MDKWNILNDEVKGSFHFFSDYTNLVKGSKGYGLTSDHSMRPGIASIAATGFALTAWVIGHRRKWLSDSEALDRVIGTLITLRDNAPHHNGFFAHFIERETAQRFHLSEYSTIDTALCVNGILVADQYFQNETIHELAKTIIDRIDWSFIVFEKEGKTLFRMAYNPDPHGDYVVKRAPGFIYHWDMVAEQKMMYLMAANVLPQETARKLYADFRKPKITYKGYTGYVSPGGNLFTYHFSEAWFDSERYLDPLGIDWFRNAREAGLANRQFCLDHKKKYPGYTRLWGLSASDGPKGYTVSGAKPCEHEPYHNGTISIYSALSSFPFTPKESEEMMYELYFNHPQTWGKYGFIDALNLDTPTPWFSRRIIGIDKGCSMIMIENHMNRFIWDLYSASPYIQRAYQILGFKERSIHVRD
ncbi:MAG: hypothetical protein FD133_516 [Erysipelotrichaceae bacterium]|nr:MAG: hypothetical protein FD179_23 [Erysipelotrichaceae bacterium]TXT19080.1 MAG: hypothetical protein FD133_516 [Erysipelotrichaceae bacterium]